MRFSGKTIVVGVTGSIAAYKALELVRALKKEGANVQVILSEGAENFIRPLSFQTLTNRPVLKNQFSGRTMKHIDLSKADALIIAPATANFVAKAAAGLADDLLSTTLQAFSEKVLIAPAMNDVMYSHQVVLRNVAKLKKIGYTVVEPDSGDLACGKKGQGRLAATQKIMDVLSTFFVPKDLKGKTVLITAGPTRTYIDPIRFISNASSGKMGYAFAKAAIERGANVVLVSGPTEITPPAGVKIIRVITTEQMFTKVKQFFKKSDIAVFAAAPSDFQTKAAKNKMPKEKKVHINLTPAPDVAAWAGAHKNENQKIVAFALQTENNMQTAEKKRQTKKADFMVLNGPANLSGEFASGMLLMEKKLNKIVRQSKISFAHEVLNATIEKGTTKKTKGTK